ncbi:hypothetical protein [Brachymonas denitrificans]|uniref:hypothetical protein n=1 Tax=Brachymonas denitrificans TaxID=28220 RepID=UPI001BCC2F59|nr:hypothetical protein [Brachymonas denitrificans]
MSHLVLAPRALLRTAPAVVLLAGAWMAQPAQASTQVACLLAGKVQQVQQQPLNERMVRVQLQQVKDDNTVRNDVECSKQFRTGDSLWVSLDVRTNDNTKLPRAGDRIWLSFRYGDDRSGTVWRKYESIPLGKYLERKNGIQ